MPNLTFTELKKLLQPNACHLYPNDTHLRRHGRFNNSAFNKPWNKNKSPKNYNRLGLKQNLQQPAISDRGL